ncbi:hypothetical protein ScPMuIL_004318 [Solemya velum]
MSNGAYTECYLIYCALTATTHFVEEESPHQAGDESLHQAEEESHPIYRERSPSNLPRSHIPSSQPQKKAKTVTDLTAVQADDLASWIEMNVLIYNKKLNTYKDARKKDALWEFKAASMDKDVDILKTWYRSIRTRYTRLVHRKSGDGASELTERDRWTLQNVAWLRVHVVEVKKKTTVSMKEKLAGEAFTEDVDADPTQPKQKLKPPLRLEPLSRRSSASSTNKASQEEERLLSNIATRGKQSIVFQTKVLEMRASPKATERTAYADWTKEVMVSLHLSLWLKFQRECTNLLYTYQEKSGELLHPVAQQQRNPAQQLQYRPQQQQYQANPRIFSGTSSTSAMWQPPLQQWPTTVRQNMYVWGSQSPV